MNSDFSNSIETETTLVVASENPEEILSKIGEISSIHNYQLLPGGTLTLSDYYFDKPSGDFSSFNWALRIRQIGEHAWIAAKGPSRETSSGGLERAEIELAWSLEAFDELSNLLAQHGLFVSGSQEQRISEDPLDALRDAGLIVIQKRQTVRVVRHIRSAEKGRLLAELALDHVIYHIGSRALLHHEIEIESKAKEGRSAIRFLMQYLLGLYPAQLREWHYSKLATGRAIEMLLGEGHLGEVLDNDYLRPGAYDLIEKHWRTRIAKFD